MMNKLEGKSFPELIAQGVQQLATLEADPSVVASDGQAAQKAVIEEAAQQEQEQDDDVDMVDLFGDDDEY